MSTHMGVSINMDTPIAGWFLLGKIHLKWMMTGGTPMTMETPIFTSLCLLDSPVVLILVSASHRLTVLAAVRSPSGYCPCPSSERLSSWPGVGACQQEAGKLQGLKIDSIEKWLVDCKKGRSC